MFRPARPSSSVYDIFPTHLAKDSENQQNKAARRWKHNLQYQLNNTVQQDAKI
jgi:hypothetical protein